MYAERIQLEAFGPVDRLDIEFPFQEGTPLPVVLVGGNGSGKSIILSHLVNALIFTQKMSYPQSPEVPQEKVYKLRSNEYIKIGSEYSFSRVKFSGGFWVAELRTSLIKEKYSGMPDGMAGTAVEALWKKMEPTKNDTLDVSVGSNSSLRSNIEEDYRGGCALYFPCDRTEYPAWMNPQILDQRVKPVELDRMHGETSRQFIARSPLKLNQDWLYDVLFDIYVLDVRFKDQSYELDGTTYRGQMLEGYPGNAMPVYNAALTVLRMITGQAGTRFVIGRRHNRIISVYRGDECLVPNIFQLSSGQLMLLNLSLSILRDFDWSDSEFRDIHDVEGIVIIDEVDLHLHIRLQSEVMPHLLRMFPRVQFILTTHSPLFVLGMRRQFGENGFAVYRLPEGRRITAEEFDEFDHAYSVVEETQKFSNDLHGAILEATRPVLVVEGITDQRYIERAAELLGRQGVLDQLIMMEGNGKDNLGKFWKGCSEQMSGTIARKAVLLFDCDVKFDASGPHERGHLSRRFIPQCDAHPVRDGIENRFDRSTLQRAREHNPKWVNIEGGRVDKIDGEDVDVPESWTIPRNRKTELCKWLCEHGDTEDFQHFGELLDIIEAALELNSATELDATASSVDNLL